jgi:3-deoxy-D-manno-octulosonic acid (KDO) 8-phosphate synthase
MKTLTKALAIVLFSLPLIASAAGKTASASMQVSFEVKESCNVQTATDAASDSKAAKPAPAVACQLKTPYQLTRNADQAAASNSRDAQATAQRQQAANGEWTITF